MAASGPVAAAPIPQDPFLAPNGASFVHDDAYQSDTYTWSGPGAAAASVQTAPFPGQCTSTAVDSAGRIITICQGSNGPILVLIDPDTLQTLSQSQLPGTSQATYGYFYLDEQDRVVVPTTSRQLWVFSEGNVGAPGLSRVKTFDLRPYIAQTDALFSALPDWQGRIWFATTAGVVGWVDRDSGSVHRIALGEGIANSFATDQSGGVFVVTNYAMYRLDLDPVSGAPVVTWREAYDRGTRKKPGQVSRGSGTSPTLMGSSFVAIADNADPRLHVLVYDRAASVAGSRIVCSVPMFAKRKSATENSFIGTDTSLIVENNYGYKGPSSVTGGLTTQPGVGRIDLDPVARTCSVVWVNTNERVPAAAAKLSLADGLVYLYTKDPDPNSLDPWVFTAVDFATGLTVSKVQAGLNSAYDSHFGAVGIAPDGAEYEGVLGGLVRLTGGTP